jgi:hypothetical protein
MQYRKYISTGPLFLRIVIVLFLRRNRTMTPTAMRASKIAASMGLPSSVDARAPADLPPVPSHTDTVLDAAIESQMTGSQRALEVRTDLSRLRKKSPATPRLQIRKASRAPI